MTMTSQVEKKQQRVVWLLPTQHTMPLSREQALDLLLNAHSLQTEKLLYEHVPKKPACGSLFIVLKAPDDPLDDDSYNWLEQEMKYKVNVRNYELEIFYRTQPYISGDLHSTIQKHVYRFSNSNFHLVHYPLPTPQKATPPPKIAPTQGHIAQIQNMQKPHVIPEYPSAPKHPQQYLETTTPKEHVRKEYYMNEYGHQWDGSTQTPNNNPINGDIMDPSVNVKVPAKYYALERYKKNHDLMDIILSPHHANSFIDNPVPPEVLSKKLEDIESDITHEEKQIKLLKGHHLRTISKHNRILSTIRQYSSMVNDFQTIEDLDNLQSEMISSLSSSARSNPPLEFIENPSSKLNHFTPT